MQFDFEKAASAGNYEALYAIEHYTRTHTYVYVDTTIHLLLNHCLNSPKVSERISFNPLIEASKREQLTRFR